MFLYHTLKNKKLDKATLGMFASGATIQAFREGEMLWWVLLMILSQAVKKNNSLGVAGGSGSSTEA